MGTKACILVFLCVLAASINTTYQQQCVTNLDVIFAMDGSNSLGQENFQRQMTSLTNMVLRMNVSESELHVGVILYSGGITGSINLTGDKGTVINEIRQMTYPDEETRTDLAIDAASLMFDLYGRNGSVPKLLIIVTDGVPTMPDLTVLSATRAKAKGINIFTIGVTVRADVTELRKIASKKNEGEYQVFVTEDFTTLEGSLNNATHRACVDLKCQEAMIDIVFVLDSSSSIGASNFQDMKNFVFEFLLFADVDSGKIRVGLVTYGDRATVQFNLNTHPTKARMNGAINGLQYQPGATNIVDALRTLRTTSFTKGNGDRPDVANVVILVSANELNANADMATAEADSTRAAGIQIYGVGLGHTSTRLLDGIISRPLEESRFMISTFAELRSVIPEVYNKFNKFCEKPPPVPACFMGVTDIWFLVEVSRTTETLSRFQYTGDFARLRNGLSKLVEIVQDPSVSNLGVSLGLIAYSDTSRILSDTSRTNSVNATANAVQQLPGGVPQGGAAMVAALQTIVAVPVKSSYKSYVAIVAPESSYGVNTQALERELVRLKGLGYTVVIFAVREDGTLDQQRIQRDASGSKYFYYIPGYLDLEAATKNFTRDGLCNGVVDNITNLCAESGHRENGVGVAPHPLDCDKYIQCYYNEQGNLDLGVVRQCPMGLHWNTQNKTCSLPSEAGCSYDRCKEVCEPYQMIGSCRSYWDCEDGVSTPKCCPENYAYVSGKGCQPNTSCTDMCGPTKSCGTCQKKPNWQNRVGYDVMMLGGNVWMPRPCPYDDFDALDCDCTAPRDQVCPADRVYDFTDTTTIRAIDEGSREGIRVNDVQKSSEGIVLGNRSAVHVTVNHKKVESEPFALELRFRELDTLSPYGETLVSSGFSCGNANSLLVSASDQFIFAEIRSSRDRLVEVKVPTKGLNKNEFKTLVLSYDNGVLALSIKDEHTQYLAKTNAPSGICLACGLDLGRGLNRQSFQGELQKIAVYSCAWPLLY